MNIRSITLAGFQCFKDDTTVPFDSLTTLIGANGSGKSAVLDALCRMFGVSSALRSVRRSDFHLATGKSYDEFEELSLKVEVILDFPELGDDEESGTAVPESFNQMAIGVEGGTPFCRVRLDAKWYRTSLPEGEVEETLRWIITADDEPKEDDFKPMRPHERSRIQAIYVPAIREPARQLKQASGNILARLMRATNWSDGGRKAIDKAATTVASTFRNEKAVSLIELQAGETWSRLQDFPDLTTVQIKPLESRIEDILNHIDVRFTDVDEQSQVGLDRLSDGLRSLFYFSLLVASFQVEQQAVSKEEDDSESDAPFSTDALRAPTLTVFAVEEPENHLSAHYLGRVVELLKELSSENAAQVVLTSHSPAILGRVDPAHVRHLRLDEKTRVAKVRGIKLPLRTSEAFKYVKEAVRAYPELYFSRLVILGEGDSEEIVLRHLAELYGLAADARSISVVPLGGRYVNHFWKLLKTLGIPHVTLLDLDRERDGGAWGRIKYACAELAKNGVAKDALYSMSDGSVLPDDEIKKMHKWRLKTADDVSALQVWAESLESHSVFFCSPLDLDFSMLKAFPEEYKGTGTRGPRLPESTDPKHALRMKGALTATLKGKNTGGLTFSDEEKDLFPWYAYLFLGQGKPTTHLLALNALSEKTLNKNCPDVLKRLFVQVKKLLNITE
jgi:putative ATP-dependent endonuclease of OLD family